MKPTELAITLAALPGRYTPGGRDGGWSSADEIGHRLALLGFKCSPQQLAAWMRPMTTCDAPWLERRQESWGWQYRVTRFGTTDIDNRFPGVRPETPHLSVYRGSEA